MIIDCITFTKEEQKEIISEMSPEEIKSLSKEMLATAMEMIHEQCDPLEIEIIFLQAKKKAKEAAQKETPIADALNTQEGKESLAAAFKEPIRLVTYKDLSEEDQKWLDDNPVVDGRFQQTKFYFPAKNYDSPHSKCENIDEGTAKFYEPHVH